MTTSYSQSLSAVAISSALERVGEALVNARDHVASATEDGSLPENAARATQESLVALCRASYDALVAWDARETDEEGAGRTAKASWRTPLDELRVQAALAEMELRDVGIPLSSGHDLVAAVTKLVGAARDEVGTALDRLRHDLRRQMS